MWQQRGAGMLMATLFLLLIVSLLGAIGLRLAGTDINDTSLQNNSVEALFLAESGVERALQRLAAGTTCASVAQSGMRFTLGRGDFEIQTSVLNATTGWCDVTILGRVLLSGAASAQRKITASLQLGSSGPSAWAVGAGGAVYAWSGSSWSAGTSNTTAQLNAVHCVSSTECWAVGNNGTIIHWLNGTWSLPIASGTTEHLLGVACIPGNASACYAVGNDIVRRWNGNNWVPSIFPGGKLTGVSCTSSACYATRDQDQIWRLNTATNTWSVNATTTGFNWNAINCLPGGECWAAGNPASNQFSFARLLAGTWNVIQYNSTPPRNLNGIYCPASNTCWAVGRARSGSLDTIIQRTASGFSYVTPSGGTDLFGVACSATNNCLAVGASGDVQLWNGSSWSQAMTGMASVNLFGVAMTGASGGGGGVQLMRWREEIIP